MNLTVTQNLFAPKSANLKNEAAPQKNSAQRFAIPSFNLLNDVNKQNSNIVPLNRDVVSFGGSKDKVLKKVAETVTDIASGNKLRADKVTPDTKIADVNYGLAITLEKEAQIPMNYLRTTLNRYLGSLVSVDNRADRPIYDLGFRIKDRDSIAEKLESIAKKFTPEDAEPGQLVTITKEMAKAEMGDIIGARITMRDGSKEAVKEVLDGLAAAVNDGKLRIKEIENYRPFVTEIPKDIVKRFKKDLGIKLSDKEIQKITTTPEYFSYGSPVDLANFKGVCKKKYREIKAVDKDLPTGYPAIHLAVELPNGYTGEIQIIGRDVEALKFLEDFYYKAKCKKKIEHTPLAERLKPLRNENDFELQDRMLDYTRWAYVGQRLKGVISHTKKIDSKFLVADQYILDRQLGFNQNVGLCNAAAEARKAKQAARRR